jgi:cob(I)alamin adenosyltransferase
MVVYTRTGDKGKTSIFSGKRLSKSAKLLNTIGSIDEVNSFLGIVGGLQKIQKDLFTINAILAGKKLKFPSSSTKNLEKQIDKIEKNLPVRKNFIYYSGSKKAALLFFARALVRRAERAIVSLPNILHTNPNIPSYLNRLSDYFFVLARRENFQKKVKEKVWR